MSLELRGHPAGDLTVKRQGTHVVEMQRRRLLLAVSEVVGENGLQEATVGSICKRAGVSRRTFYEVFSDRDECFLAALDHAIKQIGRTALPVYHREGRWCDRVRDTLLLLLELLDADAGLARMCIVETLRAGPEALESRARVLQALAAAIDEGRAEIKRGGVPPPLTAQGVVGGVLSVVHARLLEDSHGPLVELTGQLMAMIVHPYLGSVAAGKELSMPASRRPATAGRASKDPFKDVPIRFTYRTARVLGVIASHPGASNRHIAGNSGIADDGQMSRLLRRLKISGLIENSGVGQPKGEPNAWALTNRGQAIHAALSVQSD